MSPAELRAVARLGRRTARREWRRTTLVGLLVAVPVMAGIVTAGFTRAVDLTPEEEVTRDMGAADVRVEMYSDGPDPLSADDPGVAVMAGLVADLDADAVVQYRRTSWYGGTSGVLEGAWLADLPLDDPLSEGMLTLLSGRAPEANGEVAVSTAMQRDHDLAVGDTIELDDGHTPLEVVGAVVDPTNTHRPTALTTPATLDRVLEAADAGATPTWLLSVADPRTVERELYAAYDEAVGLSEAQNAIHGEQPVDAMAADAAREEGADLPPQVQVSSRPSMLQAYDASGRNRVLVPSVIATLVAAVLLAEVALIAGAAYATGARRRLRELGLLGANGATTGHVRAVVVGEAVATGIVGAAIGVVAGVAALGLGRPVMQRFTSPLITSLELSVGDLLGPAVAAVLAVAIAAWLPARTAALVPTTTALEGRMPLSQPKRWITPVGIALAAFGGLLLLVGIVAGGNVGGAVAAMGVLLAVAGTAMLTVPMIAGVGRVADRFPATLRLVLRDSGRQRTRAAAASASAMVVLLVPVLVATISFTMERQGRVDGLAAPDDHVLLPADQQIFSGDASVASSHGVDGEPWDRAAAVASIGEILPGADRVVVPLLDERADLEPAPGFSVVAPENIPVHDPSDNGQVFWNQWGVADTHVAMASPELVAALDDPATTAAVEDRQLVVLGVTARETTVELSGRELDAVEVPAHVLRHQFPRVLVPPADIEALGLEVAGTADLFVTASPLTGSERQAIWESTHVGSVELGTVGRTNGPWVRWAAVGATLLIALLILALVTMLSATESDHDLRTMVAVGAPPRMRRRFLGLQSGVHALVGAVLAVPLGLALAFSVARAEGPRVQWGVFGQVTYQQLFVDWQAVAAVVLAVPTVIALGIALMVRSATTAPPRRVG